MKNGPFHKRLGFAVTGVAEGWRNERSFRLHILIALGTIAGLCWLQPAPIWWAIILLTIGMVLALELINGAMEALIDHLHPDIHPRIRVVKDMAAGAVLIMAMTSMVMAALVVLDWL